MKPGYNPHNLQKSGTAIVLHYLLRNRVKEQTTCAGDYCGVG